MIMLRKHNEIVPFQRVTIKVKTLRVEEAEEALGGKKKQDILVGDSSGTSRLMV